MGWAPDSGANRVTGRVVFPLVTVTKGTTKLSVKRFATQANAAQPTVVFQVKGLTTAGTYRVLVRHIRGAAQPKFSYTVKLFTP